MVRQKKYENRNGESVSAFTSPSRFLLSFLLVFFLRFLLFVGKFTHYVVNTLPKESDLKRFTLEVSGIAPVTCTWSGLVHVSAGNFQISSVEYNQSTLRSSTVLHQALITFSSEKRRQPEICKNLQRSLCACESIRVFYSYFTRQQEPKHLDAFTGYAYHYTHYMGY